MSVADFPYGKCTDKSRGTREIFFLAQTTVKNEFNINFSNTLKDRKANIHV